MRKEFAPRGSKFFPYRVDPFSEEDKTILPELPPPKIYLLALNENSHNLVVRTVTIIL